jgi:AraC-like DNA-binding protein
MTVVNELDRFHLAGDAIKRRMLGPTATPVLALFEKKLREHAMMTAATSWERSSVLIADHLPIALDMHTACLEVEGDLPRYLELPPSPDLSPWISHFRVIRGPLLSSAAPTVLRLLADGCAGVVIDRGSTAPASPPVFMGVMPAATVVTVAERREIIGVRFKPGGALPFVPSWLHEFTGRRIPLPLLWGDLAQRMGNAACSATLHERVRALEDGMRGRMRQYQAAASSRQTTTAREVALVSRAIAHLGHDATVRVSDVAVALGVGERRLERAFNRAVGIPPKVFHRMRRCGEAARLIRHACGAHPPPMLERRVARCNWSAIASDAGYADQAHFIREFRALIGVTPTAYAREHHPVGFMQYDGNRTS